MKFLSAVIRQIIILLSISLSFCSSLIQSIFSILISSQTRLYSFFLKALVDQQHLCSYQPYNLGILKISYKLLISSSSSSSSSSSIINIFALDIQQHLFLVLNLTEMG